MDGPRACRPDELDSMRQLQDTVFRPSGDLSMFDEFPTMFAPGNCERLRVIAEDGRIVSAINYVARTADILGNHVRIGSLGAVATYEDDRGRGYATVLLADTFATMRAEGLDVVLISGQRGLYERAGCAIAGCEHRFSLDGDAISRLPDPAGIAVSETTDAEIPDIVAAHEREPIRFVRSEYDWSGFLSICRLQVRGLEPPWGVKRCYTIRRGGRVMGHVILHYNRDRQNPGFGITEFSGPRRDVFAAVRAIGVDWHATIAIGALLPSDTEALAILDEAGVATPSQKLGGHRMAILHEDIIARYDAWLFGRVGEDATARMRIEHTDRGWNLVADGTRIVVGDDLAINEALFATGTAGLEGDPNAIRALESGIAPAVGHSGDELHLT